jgi:hypothetical protein
VLPNQNNGELGQMVHHRSDAVAKWLKFGINKQGTRRKMGEMEEKQSGGFSAMRIAAASGG